MVKKIWDNKEKRKELISYLFFGITTTLVNILLFQGLLYLQMDYKIANLIAILLSKVYAYVTNKLFVFQSRCNSVRDLLVELIKFIAARGTTGLIDYFGLLFAVEVLGCNKIITKYVLQAVVIVLNYVFSKLLVFRKNKD